MLDSTGDAAGTPDEAHALRARKRVYREQRDALIELSAHIAPLDDAGSSLDPRFTEVAATTLRVARASVWLLTTDHTEIRCIDLFDADRQQHTSGLVLRRSDAPRYFAALPVMDVIAANDAWSDPRTNEFRDGYLTPLGITSMLDAPIRVGGSVVGVLCHEHIGPARTFGADEEAFAIALANLVSLRLAEVRRRELQAESDIRLAALEAAANGIVITDVDGRIVWVNPAFSALTQYRAEEAIGRDPGELLRSGEHDDAFYAHMWRTIMAGQVWRGQLRNRRKDGSVYTEEQTITPVRTGNGAITHFIAVKHDLTARHELEERLLQAQKLETVGRLAGGIAHDFNNLLAVINGTAELAACGLREDDALRGELDQIRAAGDRAALLTGQLLAFSRRQMIAPESIDLSSLAADMLGMLRPLCEDVVIQLSPGIDPAWVRVDRAQIGQLITNLVVNARDAMPAGGTVTLKTRVSGPLGEAVEPGADLELAPYVLLTVADTGIGMSDDVLAHVFEPFFTTKGRRGYGLGLPTVYGVVQQSGGTIDIATEPGRGTTVRVLLPRIPTPVASAPAPRRNGHVPGSGRVMIVEDEEVLCRLAARILTTAGYDVVTAPGGAEALTLLANGAADIELLITDVIMPGMGGRELARRAVAQLPGLKVLFTSGYSDDEMLRLDVLERESQFLPKPFTMAELTARVRTLLDT